MVNDDKTDLGIKYGELPFIEKVCFWGYILITFVVVAYSYVLYEDKKAVQDKQLPIEQVEQIETIEEVEVKEEDPVPSHLTEEQFLNLQLVKRIGEPDDLSQTLMGICLQETICGKIGPVGHMSAPVGKRSYGLMQLKVTAVKDVLRAKPEYDTFSSDEEIIAKLIYDKEFNVTMALEYFKLLRNRGLSWKASITSYNLGPTGAKQVDAENYKYTNKVINHIRTNVALMEQK